MGKISSAIADILRTAIGKPKKDLSTAAIVLAGGHSTRMGEGVSKQQLLLMDKPVIAHTLLAFQNCEDIAKIVLVAKEDELPLYADYKEKYGLSKLSATVSGGDTRQESAQKGFAACSENIRYVAIHDGARCLITSEEISAVCTAAYRFGAATAAVRSSETVKREKDGFIDETLDREHIYLARTPQVFGADLYRAALAVGKRDQVSVTDDCSLVEHIEYPVKLVPCSTDNIKITTPEDICHAAAILQSREEHT